MKIGIIVTVYNRPEYLKECLESLSQANIPNDALIVLVNDCSTNQETNNLFNQFYLEGKQIIKFNMPVNNGVCPALQKGFEACFSHGCKLVMNLDSDAIVKPDFIEQLVALKKKHPLQIVTGFNSINKNKDGKDRHPVLATHDGYLLKSSVGGINMLVAQPQYEKYIAPSLQKVIREKGNWDQLACIAAMHDQKPIVCIAPSVVQHIGIHKSSMGHQAEEPDVACDFYNLFLPDVTLISVDCNHVHEALAAADISTREILFGSVKILSSMASKDDRIVKIPPLTSKQMYNQFMVKQLADYISTKYLLIIQGDGYVLNWKAWSDEFYQYDYIGATWWYKDNMNVGNGGFSFRSRRLHEILQSDPNIVNTYPEDHQICRVYRPYLEEKYGIRFATEEVANKFAIEAYGLTGEASTGRKYGGQFGFHGYNVDYTGSGLSHIPQKPRR